MKKTQIKKLVPLLFIILIGAGCTIEQEALVKSDGSGNVHFNFEVAPYFVSTLQEMSALTGQESNLPEGQLFDVEQIKKDFSKNRELQLETISTPEQEVLEGMVSFNNISSVFQSEDTLMESGIISYQQSQNRTTITVHLDKGNYKQIYKLFPMIDNPLFDMFGPQEGENISESEYLEMITLAFGEEAAAGLEESSIQLAILVQGTIISQTGGTVTGNKVVFDIPLIKILTLNQPLNYDIVFR